MRTGVSEPVSPGRRYHERGASRRNDPRKYISAWTEKDLLGTDVVDSFVVIFRTSGCYWAKSGGCSMCGYSNDTSLDVSTDDLMHQLETVLDRNEGQKVTKIFTSGSFFDEREVPSEFRHAVLDAFSERSGKIIVESLAIFTTKELVEEGVDACGRFEVALGLESANPVVLKHSVNKPFGLEHHLKASTIVRDAGGTVKTYILIKPPFLTEREAIEDAVVSAEKVAGHTDTISFNPVNVQGRTLVSRLWQRGEYRPPWLWSVSEVLTRTKGLGPRVMSAPTAGGLRRGAHNCGRCDGRLLVAIRDFSLGLRDDFEGYDCECKERWLDHLELEGALQSPVDIDRLLEWFSG